MSKQFWVSGIIIITSIYRQLSHRWIIKHNGEFKVSIVLNFFRSPVLAGILKDKTMDDILSYIPNVDKQIYSFYELQCLVEKFEHY